MRYLILSDIHSNLEALEEVLKLAEGRYDKMVCLGDLVGYGPDPNRVVDIIRSHRAVVIRGNHDKVCCGVEGFELFNPMAQRATLWTQGQLTPANLEYLRRLPAGPLRVDWFEIFHGSWRDEDEYILGPEEAIPNLRELPAPLGLFGHTHVQGGFMMTSTQRVRSIPPVREVAASGSIRELEAGNHYLVNPGSVGQPRDGDWRAGFAVLSTDLRRVEYFRLTYPRAKTQEKMRTARLPDPLIRRLAFGH